MKDSLRSLFRFFGYYSLPSNIIIGAQKCGTSAIYKYLYVHPQLSPSRVKETDYLSEKASFEEYSLRNYSKYFALPHRAKWVGKKCFEASPSYMYIPNTAGRMHYMNPDVKILVTLRNPVDRAYSAYTMYRKMKDHENPILKQLYEKRSFDEVINQDIVNIHHLNPYNDRKGILLRGLYYYQLLPYFSLFTKEQIMIIEQDSMKKDTLGVLNEICQFFNVSPYKPEYLRMAEERREIKKTKYDEGMSIENRSQLLEFYSEHNKMLFDLIGKTYNWNS